MNTVDGKLLKPNEGDSATADYKLAVVDLFKQGKILEARKMLCSPSTSQKKWMNYSLDV